MKEFLLGVFGCIVILSFVAMIFEFFKQPKND
jgi:hypothetical protein